MATATAAKVRHIGRTTRRLALAVTKISRLTREASGVTHHLLAWASSAWIFRPGLRRRMTASH